MKKKTFLFLASYPLHQPGQAVVHVVEHHVDRAFEVVVLGRCVFGLVFL